MGMNQTEQRDFDNLKKCCRKIEKDHKELQSVLHFFIRNYARLETMLKLLANGDSELVKNIYKKMEVAQNGNEAAEIAERLLSEAHKSNTDPVNTEGECIQPEETGTDESNS